MLSPQKAHPFVHASGASLAGSGMKHSRALNTALRTGAIWAGIVLLVLSGAQSASSADIPSPGDLNPGDSFRFMFLTLTGSPGNQTNIDNWNNFVNLDASGYTYEGNAIAWKAAISTAVVDARDNVGGFGTAIPVYLVTGTQVANDLTANSGGLWNTLLAAPNIGIDGSVLSFPQAWGGSNADGTNSGSPVWSGFQVSVGTPNSAAQWLSSGSAGPAISANPVFAVSETLTVPVPEPSALALAAIACLGGLAALRRRTWA